MRSRILWGVLGGGIFLLLGGDREKGQEVFARRCSGCHEVDSNKEGPRLRGVFGRRAAAVDGFVYSDALKKAGIRWDEATLERWLAGPEAVVPETDMEFRVADPGERRLLLLYLKSLTN